MRVGLKHSSAISEEMKPKGFANTWDSGKNLCLEWNILAGEGTDSGKALKVLQSGDLPETKPHAGGTSPRWYTLST